MRADSPALVDHDTGVGCIGVIDLANVLGQIRPVTAFMG